MSKASIRRHNNTVSILSNFNGNKHEFAMLKGLICAEMYLPYGSTEHRNFNRSIDLSMIAKRMDELGAHIPR